MEPATIALGSLARFALLLFLLVLEEAAALAFLNDAGPHNLPSEPTEQFLLRLIVIDDYLDIIRRPEEEGVGVREGGAHDGHDIGRAGG